MATDLGKIKEELFDKIVTAINESPLTDKVKQESIEALKLESQRIKAGCTQTHI